MRGFSAPAHSDLPPPGGKPYAHCTARIQTGHVAGTAYSSARSRPLTPAPVYPSPARCTPAAAFLHIPGWPESQSSAPSGKISQVYAVSGVTPFHAASTFPWPALPYCGRGNGSSAWHHRHSTPAGSLQSAVFSGTKRVFQLTCTYESRKPGVKEKIVDMAHNGSGVRDTARTLFF